MSIAERNQFIEILYSIGTKRKNIPVIIKDLEEIGLFEDIIPYEDEDELKWAYLEEEAKIIFDKSNKEERANRLRQIKEHKERFLKDKNLRTAYKFCLPQISSDARVRLKRQELIGKNILKPDKEDELEVFEIEHLEQNRYGRTPLHEAIAIRDLELVKQYISQGVHLETKDNNGHTPKEMAYYEGYEEALKVFRAYEASLNMVVKTPKKKNKKRK